MAGAKIAAGSGTSELGLDSNGFVKSTLPTTTTQSGMVGLATRADAAAANWRDLEGTEDFRLRVGEDGLIFQEVFAGSAVNTTLWQQATTVNGATVTVTGGFAVLTTGTTANAHAVLKGRRLVQLYATFPTYFELLGVFNQSPVNNTVIEWGAGIVDPTTTAAAPTDGAFFRITSTGTLLAVVSEGGTEQTTSLSGGFAALIGTSATRHYIINVHEDAVTFWIDDVQVAQITRGASGSGTVRSWSLPLFMRAYNTASVPASSSVVRFSNAGATQGDIEHNRPWQYAIAGMGGHCSQGQTGFATLGTTGQISNSADPTAAAPTNTTAALGSGLGGIFRANAQAGAATDLIISSYQVPAGTAAAPGKTLMLTGLAVGAINTGVAVATTPTTYALFLCYGHTAVSLATAESSTTKAPRRIALGTMTFPVGAAVGATPTNGDVVRTFNTPVVVNAGEFVQVVARCVVGTATASQVTNFYIEPDGYFE